MSSLSNVTEQYTQVIKKRDDDVINPFEEEVLKNTNCWFVDALRQDQVQSHWGKESA